MQKRSEAPELPDGATLPAARRADADQATHEEAQAAGVTVVYYSIEVCRGAAPDAVGQRRPTPDADDRVAAGRE